MNIYKIQAPEGKRLIIAKDKKKALERLQYLHSNSRDNHIVYIPEHNVSLCTEDIFPNHKIPMGRMKLLLHCWNCWEWNHDNQLHNCAKCMKLLLEKKRSKNISVFANKHEKENKQNN